MARKGTPKLLGHGLLTYAAALEQLLMLVARPSVLVRVNVTTQRVNAVLRLSRWSPLTE